MNRPDHWLTGGQEISTEEIQTRLLIEGTWLQTAQRLAQDAYLRKLAEQHNLSLTEEEMQKEVDEFRQHLGLHQAEDTHRWLQDLGLTVEQLGEYCEIHLLRQKLKHKLFPEEKIRAEYQQHPERYRFARVSHLLVPDRGAAEELLLNATEDEDDFSHLARQYSTDEHTRAGGGYLGIVSLDQPQWFSQHHVRELLAADSGTILGPWEYRSQMQLVKVEERGQLPLDQSLISSIREDAFEDFLGSHIP